MNNDILRLLEKSRKQHEIDLVDYEAQAFVNTSGICELLVKRTKDMIDWCDTMIMIIKKNSHIFYTSSSSLALMRSRGILHELVLVKAGIF